MAIGSQEKARKRPSLLCYGTMKTVGLDAISYQDQYIMLSSTKLHRGTCLKSFHTVVMINKTNIGNI